MSKFPKFTSEILILFQDQFELNLNDLIELLPKFEVTKLRYSINHLCNKGILMKLPNLEDMRRFHYRIATQKEFSENVINLKIEEIDLYKSIYESYFRDVPWI